MLRRVLQRLIRDEQSNDIIIRKFRKKTVRERVTYPDGRQKIRKVSYFVGQRKRPSWVKAITTIAIVAIVTFAAYHSGQVEVLIQFLKGRY